MGPLYDLIKIGMTKRSPDDYLFWRPGYVIAHERMAYDAPGREWRRDLACSPRIWVARTADRKGTERELHRLLASYRVQSPITIDHLGQRRKRVPFGHPDFRDYYLWRNGSTEQQRSVAHRMCTSAKEMFRIDAETVRRALQTATKETPTEIIE